MQRIKQASNIISKIFPLIVTRLHSDTNRLARDAKSKLDEIVIKEKRRQDNPRGISKPVFLFGCQRSGTNMTIRALAMSWKIELFNEDNYYAFDQELFLREAKIINKIIEDSYARIVLFKPIMDTYRAARILTNFPKSKGLFIFRAYNDVVNSLIRTNVAIGASARYFDFFLSKLKPETQEHINNLRQNAYNFESLLALFWYIQNSFFFDNDLNNNTRVKLICYENIVSDPRKEISEICNFIGEEFVASMANGISTKSINKNSPPTIAPKIKLACEDLNLRLHQTRQ